jgi:hypothetical protein
LALRYRSLAVRLTIQPQAEVRKSPALNRGLKMRGDTAYQVTFERPWGNQVGAAIVGALISTDASSVVERLTFSIAEAGNGTRIVLDRYMVKVGKFGREDVSLANGPAPGLDRLQATLDEMAPSLTPVVPALAAKK